MSEDEIIGELKDLGYNPCPTGSRWYGTPTEDSDQDFFVLLDWLTAHDLRARADSSTMTSPEYPLAGITMSLRFGALNLLVLTHHNQWQAWWEGTNNLKARAPVTRDEAVAEFQSQFRKHGVAL